MSDEPRVTVRNIGPGKPHVVYEDDDRLPLEDENARLRAQVKYLRGYAIYTRAALYKFEHGAHPTDEQYEAITGAIDGNMAVAADRAVKGDDDA